MAKITLPDNGQTIELPDEIASSDEQIRAALAPLYPAIANATISREQGADGQTVVKITKVAGTKGLQTAFEVPGFEAEAGEPTELDLALIRTDGGTQTREAVRREIAEEYAEALRQGARFPAVTVFYDGEAYWLADGFHRMLAHIIAKLPTVQAYVRQGTRRDAVLYSVGANHRHGVMRTNADKRRAVETLLLDPEWRQWSDHEIGRQAGVSHTFVGKVRGELSGSGHQMPQERLVQRGSQVYTFPADGGAEAVPDGQLGFVEGLGEATPEVEPQALDVRRCRVCGCTDSVPCEGGCSWYEDDLCSACVGKAVEPIEAAAEEVAPEAPAPVKQATSPSPVAAPAPAARPPSPAPVAAPQPVPAKPLPWHETQVTVTLTLQPGAENPDDRKVLVTAQAPGVAPYFAIASGEGQWELVMPVRTALETMKQRVEAALAAASGEKAEAAAEPVQTTRESALSTYKSATRRAVDMMADAEDALFDATSEGEEAEAAK